MKQKARKQEQKEADTLKRILLLVITLILSASCMTLAKAMPHIQLISQTNPVEYGTIQTIEINITADTPNSSNTTITQAVIEFDQINHSLEKEAEHYTYSWLPAQKGVNTYTVFATDSANETQNYSDSFFVIDTTPPEITETQPQGTLTYNLVELKAITNENSTCKYDTTDISYAEAALCTRN
jgi:hypothetical protein